MKKLAAAALVVIAIIGIAAFWLSGYIDGLIKNAFASVDPAAVDAFIKVHELLIDPSDRDWMERMWDPNGTAVDITS